MFIFCFQYAATTENYTYRHTLSLHDAFRSIKRLFALGELSAAAARAFGEGGQVSDSHAALIEVLRAELGSRTGIRILVKGSRGSARSEEHTSELQSLMRHSYAVF